MNALHIGTAEKDFSNIAEPFLLLDDGPIAEHLSLQFPNAKVFNPRRDSFNPLNGLDYKRARDISAAVYSASPEGKDTLTVRNGKRALTRMLLANTTRLDKLAKIDHPGYDEAKATIEDILQSPTLKRVLCSRAKSFSFKSSVIAKLDRAELGDFDAFLLGQFLIGQFQGHIVVPDFGFYGREHHTALIRQNRLVCGVNYLAELPDRLQQSVLTIKDKRMAKLTRRDAEELIFYTDTPSGNPANLM
jgi:hypothetical protein